MISDLERSLINRRYTPVAWYVVRRCIRCRTDLWDDPDRLYVITSDCQLAGCGICETHLRSLRYYEPKIEVVETWQYSHRVPRDVVSWPSWRQDDRLYSMALAMRAIDARPIILPIV